ncbi:hypothetical protein C0995_007438, partial [Termitomyces sp. Mi166
MTNPSYCSGVLGSVVTTTTASWGGGAGIAMACRNNICPGPARASTLLEKLTMSILDV